jgi:uncharacterized protein
LPAKRKNLEKQQKEVVQLLVEHGVNLNAQHHSAFLTAVRYCKEDIVRYLVAQGAELDKLNRTGSGAYSQAYYGNYICPACRLVKIFFYCFLQ